MEGEIVQMLSAVGQALGIPACIGLCWLVFTVKSILGRLTKVENDNALLQSTLSDIRADVSFLRGRAAGSQQQRDGG